MSASDLIWADARLPAGWQGIAYVSLGPTDPPVPGAMRLTLHMAEIVAPAFAAEHVAITGPESLDHDVVFAPGTAMIHVDFPIAGGHGSWTVDLTAPSGVLLHPFFSAAKFVFAIQCEAGDCRPSSEQAPADPESEPAIDLLGKDYRGLSILLGDRVRVRNQAWADLSPASLERVLLDLLAHQGDMLSYYQDRVANEAFLDSASQRFSLVQHAVLVGERLDEHEAATTLLAFDGMPTIAEVPAGLQVRMSRRPDEAAVVFSVVETTAVDPLDDADHLLPAQWPDAGSAMVPAGATTMLLLGDCPSLRVGQRLALRWTTETRVCTIARLEVFEAPGWVDDPNEVLSPTLVELTRVHFERALDVAVPVWDDDPDIRLRVHGNLVEARHGVRVRAVLPTNGGPPSQREDLRLVINQRDAIVVRDTRAGEPRWHLRSLRLPVGPLLWDRDDEGQPTPALELEVDGEPWFAQEHLHRSHSYDDHYTVTSDEDGRAWLHFGDDRHGRAIAVEPDAELGIAAATASVELIVRYRIGEPTTGNVALAKLTEIVPPRSDETTIADALAELGAVRISNVTPATGGRRQVTRAAVREILPAALRGGSLRRAVTLDDYARVAEQLDERVGRAAARALGGVFNTVLVLIDERGEDSLSDELRETVEAGLQTLRMTGREVVVRGPDYVPLEVELAVCAQIGFARHRLRERLLAALRPGSDERPGYFHPDRLSFGDDLELGDLLAFVQSQPGVRSVKALEFRPLRDPSSTAVHSRIIMAPTEVALLDADGERPERGRLRVKVIGLDHDVDEDQWAIGQPPEAGEALP